VAGSCEHGNENLGFAKHGDIIDQLSDCGPLKMSASWTEFVTSAWGNAIVRMVPLSGQAAGCDWLVICM
jgi:hypothetical protein